MVIRIRPARVLAWLILALISGCAFALDNPDAPDRIAAFEAREEPYLESIRSRADTTEAYRNAYAEYAAFLDAELNRAYGSLMEQLEEADRARLRAAQRAWIRFRDAEFELIDRHWRRARYGSSAVISRGDYRSAILRDRVITLLRYLRNY
ncbi:DUF1311 domain-containing protein [Ectothiorhodospiraceae bacterium WFHF3C12]|nr:DUF1311 domain-containing protein [Ectothiorhodospiraceae bacterium WFHF3C12]